MKKTDVNLVILNDLLKINTDRVERYKKAGYDTADSELKSIFYLIADESRKNITDINKLILQYYDAVKVQRPMYGGKIYRDWSDVRSKFSGTLRNNLLNSFEFGEMAALAAYALAKTDSSNTVVLELVNRHYDSMKASMEVIKSYRQAYDKLDRVR
ncbi:MAG TPA: PA2169 family four-helix-bundle protein [Cyclobacteriaceae bacterium]|nr:PA2169 family four-helix-bundle protein [Cyclobacteriaceae bacterium]